MCWKAKMARTATALFFAVLLLVLYIPKWKK